MEPYSMNKPGAGKGGCLKAGVIALVLLVVVLTVAGAIYAYRFYSALRGCSSEVPMEVEVPPLNKDSEKSLEDKYGLLEKNIRERHAVVVEIDNDELSSMVAKVAAAADMDKGARLWLDDDAVHGEMALPIKDQNGGVRYINTKFAVNLSIRNRKVNLKILECTIGERRIPGFLLGLLNSQGLDRLIEENIDPEAFAAIDTVEVKGGKLIISTRAN